MRQTSSAARHAWILRGVAFVLAFILLGGGPLLADITGMTLKVSEPNDAGTGKSYNAGVNVKLSATWTKGDTPPFAVTFKSNDSAIGTANTGTNNADFVISGASLAGGQNPKVFKAFAIETAVPNAKPTPDAAGDKAVTIDTTLPVVTVTVDNGPNFSTVAGSNEVKFTVSSDKDVTGNPEVTISPAISGVTPSLDGTPTSKQFKYKMTLTGTVPAGTYVIRAVCKDQTLPAATANSGAGQVGFGVQTSGPQPAVIQTSTPVSPTHLTSFKLSGKVTTGMVSVQVFEGATKVADGQLQGTDGWEAQIINVTEGDHRYSVKGKDSLGNVSAGSGEYVMRIDTTSPATPKLVNPKSPTNLTKVSISGNSATDPLGGGVNSLPVTVALKKSDGTPVASVTANADGSFTFTDVNLPDTDNTFFAVAEDNAKGSPGNLSGFSNFVRILRDPSSGNTNALFISGTSFASQPVPLASGTWIGPGNYSIQVNFNKDMASDTNPTIGLTPANGSEVSNSSGHWVGSSTFVGQISIPAGQGATYDGKAKQLRVSGAKDTAGNVMNDSTTLEPFAIDTTPPTTTFDTMDPIYVSASMTSVQVKGTSSDAGSGVGFVTLTWEKFDGTSPGSASIPIFDGASYNWTYPWDVSTLGAGKYKIWAIAGDKTKPTANLEVKSPTGFRTVLIAKTVPNVSRISIGDLAIDINAMNGGASPVIASPVIKLTAVMIDNGGSGLNLAVPPMIFTLTHQPTNTTVTGNFANNASDTVTFSFAALTQNGTYTVAVQPLDKAGNSGILATRSFIVDTTGPNTVSIIPASATTVNDRNTAMAQDVVWGFINDSEADYSSSSIEVSYNGRVVGNQIPYGTVAPASTTALVWDLYGPASHSTDQSADGRYDVTITPRDVVGNVGAPKRMYFKYDSQGPGYLAKQASGSWVGLDDKKMGVQLSDAPKDISTWHGAPPAEEASWQNGQGTGANIDNSSFTIVVEGTTFTGTRVGTSSLELDRPAAPNADESGPGVTSMTAEVRAIDRVTDGGPNLRNASWTHQFDYLRPNMTFDDWVEGAKFCKNRIELPGSVTDRGANVDVLKVVKAETSYDERYERWTAVTTTDALPAYSSSFTAVLDVSGVPEGNLTIQGRCFDLASNSSAEDAVASVGVPASVSINIVRTPPPPPTLVLPLNDSVTKQRGNTFKWSKVDAADRYIFQVADDSGFNNIVNTLTASGPATFTGVLGQVTVQTQGSFSAPKDGTYYWRVASIELCRDGYLQSAWSATWRLVIDTVKPKVLEVSPTPSSGNKITTGMVTFTIRFNELMDTTVAPVVALTSAGGQQMLIEQISYRDNTWTGTTVIPKDSSAVYDGNAVLSISGAKDRAGNEMETDSTNQIIINTGPAFETKIFSNPAHEYEIMIITRSTEALQAPPTCSVTQGGAQVPVMMNFLKERYYAGSYRIDAELSGKAYIDISGTDLYGMVGRGSVEFAVTSLTPASSLRVSTPDGMGSIDIGSGTVAKTAGLYLLSRTALGELTPASVTASVLRSAGLRASAVNGAVGSTDEAELREVLALEEIGPSSLRLSRKLRYTGTVKNFMTSIPTEKIALYRQNGDGWAYCGGQLKGEQITAEVAGGGRLALMADLKAPRVSKLVPAPNERLEDPVPVFEGQFADGGSGLLSESIELRIDGDVQPGVKLETDGSFRWMPKQPLKKGQHQIEVSVADRVGNSIRQAFTVTAPGPFALDELQVFPNPSRNQAIWFTYNLGQRADEIALKIYDVSGKQVTSFETIDFTSLASGKLRWDLRNNDGATVSNGVYFYRFEARRGGTTVKTRGKLAILR